MSLNNSNSKSRAGLSQISLILLSFFFIWFSILDPWSLILDPRYSILDPRSWFSRKPVAVCALGTSWFFSFFHSILDPWSSILDPWSSILDPRSSILDICPAYKSKDRTRDQTKRKEEPIIILQRFVYYLCGYSDANKVCLAYWLTPLSARWGTQWIVFNQESQSVS